MVNVAGSEYTHGVRDTDLAAVPYRAYRTLGSLASHLSWWRADWPMMEESIRSPHRLSLFVPDSATPLILKSEVLRAPPEICMDKSNAGAYPL